MTVTAIIPTYNRLRYIRRAIESVLTQTVSVDEVLVVDDGSSDGTADAIEAEYGGRIRVLRQTHTGVSGARRHGVAQATGDWIAFLDSDDKWGPHHNRDLIGAADRVPEDVAWIFGDLHLMTDEGCAGRLFDVCGLSVEQNPQIFSDSLTVVSPMACLLEASLIRRNALVSLDCFGQGLTSYEDEYVAYQIACRYRFAAIPFVVCQYYRTLELAESSLAFEGLVSPDQHRSRMMSYSLVIESGRQGQWKKRYAAEVRSLCKALAHRNEHVSVSLALRQFRYGGVSMKGILFCCAALVGRRGVRTWNWIAESRRRYLTASQGELTEKWLRGFKGRPIRLEKPSSWSQ